MPHNFVPLKTAVDRQRKFRYSPEFAKQIYTLHPLHNLPLKRQIMSIPSPLIFRSAVPVFAFPESPAISPRRLLSRLFFRLPPLPVWRENIPMRGTHQVMRGEQGKSGLFAQWFFVFPDIFSADFANPS